MIQVTGINKFLADVSPDEQAFLSGHLLPDGCFYPCDRWSMDLVEETLVEKVPSIRFIELMEGDWMVPLENPTKQQREFVSEWCSVRNQALPWWFPGDALQLQP